MKWWGPFLLLLLGGFFIYNSVSSYLGFTVPPLGMKGKDKHVRKGSHHTRRHHGYYFGGGYRAGK